MPQLFRKPQPSAEEDDWTPPDYATPISESDSGEAWKPPSYATPIKAEERKPSIFSRVISAISPPKIIKHTPTDVPDKNVKEWDQKGEYKSDYDEKGNEIKRPEPKKDELPIRKPINPDITRSDTNILGVDQNKIADMASKLPESWHGLPIRYPAAFLGSLAGTLGEAFSAPEQVATDFATAGLKGSAKAAAEELPIRPPVRIPSSEEIAAKKTPEIAEEIPKVEESQVKQPDIPIKAQKPIEEVKKSFVNPFEKPKESASPELESSWKPPEYATPVVAKAPPKELPIIEHPLLSKQSSDELKAGTPESLHPQLTALKNYGDGVLYTDFDKKADMTPESVKALFPDKDVEVTELATNEKLPSRFRVDIKGADPVESDKLGNDIEHSVGGSFDSTQELSGGLGGIKPSSRELDPNKGPYGAALDKLFNSLGNIQESRVQQDIINKAERAKRFAAFSDVKEEGAAGAAKSLSQLKGEFENVNIDKLKMTKPQVDSLFTAVKRANITSGEKARGYTTLFKIFNGELPQRNELRVLDDVFGNNFSSKIIEMHGGLGATGIKLAKAANTMKSMQNSISLAAPLRHGIGLVARKEFYPAFADMFKFFGNKDYYNSAMQALEERPNYMLGRESGLFMAKQGSLMNSEEEFLNSYIGKVPLVRDVVGASQRAYTGFLNKLRADTFDSMIKQASELGNESHTSVGNQIVPSKTTKAIARYINNATGRGDLGSLNKMTNELNMLLWSPRMIASRISMLTDPTIYTGLPKGMRLDGLKSLLGIVALGTTIDTLAAYGGAKVSTNILSTDYGKSRFGTKLIDPWGGFQQYIVGAARFLAGKTDSNIPTSRLDIAGRFLANKESPAASLAHTILTAKKFTGGGDYTDQYNNKTSIQNEVAKRFMPIFAQDLQDLATTQPDFSDDIGLNTALGVASLAGMSQDYPEKKGKIQFRKMKLR